MAFDILVVIILAVSMVQGFRSGFLYTLVHTLGWLASVIVAFVFKDKVSVFVEEKFQLREKIYTAFYERVSDSVAAGMETLSSLPQIIRKNVLEYTDTFAADIAEKLTNITYSLLLIISIALACKLVLWLLTEAFSRRKNGGFTGIPDGLLGAVLGLARGFLVVFVVFALLVPIMNMLSPENAEWLLGIMDDSAVAGDLYENNLLLLIFRGFLSKG